MALVDRQQDHRRARLLDWVRDRPVRVQDGTIVVAVLLAQFLSLAAATSDEVGGGTVRPVDAGAYALVVFATVPLLVRRRRPYLSLAAALGALVALAVFDYPEIFVGYAVLVAIYSVSVHRGLRAGVTAAVVASATLLVSYRIGAWDPNAGQNASDLLAIVVAVALGDGTRNRVRLADAQAARLAAAAGEQERIAEQTLLAERARIARELHDLVAHSMSIVTVQAGMGHHLIDENPTKAKEALATIETTSRQALTEMRRMLGLLRETGDAPATASALEPQPGSADIAALTAEAEASGLDVELVLRPESATSDLPSVVALSAYRIIQEALTNVRKHAHAAHATVTLDRRPDQLVIAVEDDGRGASTMVDRTGGFGLVGMRERAAAVGGELVAGPRPGGGFRVHATIPLGDHP